MQPVKLFTPIEDDGEVQQTEVEVLVQPSPGGNPTELKTSLARAISKTIGRTNMQPLKLFTPTEDDGEVQQTEVKVLVQSSPGGDPTKLKTSLARAISMTIGRTTRSSVKHTLPLKHRSHKNKN